MLILQLKRFDLNAETMRCVKRQEAVQLSINLNLCMFVVAHVFSLIDFDDNVTRRGANTVRWTSDKTSVPIAQESTDGTISNGVTVSPITQTLDRVPCVDLTGDDNAILAPVANVALQTALTVDLTADDGDDDTHPTTIASMLPFPSFDEQLRWALGESQRETMIQHEDDDLERAIALSLRERHVSLDDEQCTPAIEAPNVTLSNATNKGKSISPHELVRDLDKYSYIPRSVISHIGSGTGSGTMRLT